MLVSPGIAERIAASRIWGCLAEFRGTIAFYDSSRCANLPSSRRMALRKLPATLLVTAVLCGCSDSTAPSNPESTATVTDPAGDAFGTGAGQWDVTTFTITRDAAGITVRLDFTIDVISPMTGDTNAMVGFVDFDVDQKETTGITAVSDEYRRDGGSSGIGSDYQLALSDYAADATVAVLDARGAVTGRVKPAFNGHTVTIRIPRTMLGNDDGLLDATAIVGATSRPSDIAPETGHLTVKAS